MNSQETQPHINMYPFSSKFPCHPGPHTTLNREPPMLHNPARTVVLMEVGFLFSVLPIEILGALGIQGRLGQPEDL